MTTAVVVGSGPNGLAAAVYLAREGVEVTVLEAAGTIGGGTRTSELTPGLLHDHCSATHPMAVGSPFLRSLDLGRHGLTWRLPDIDCAHPLDSGEAGVLHRSVQETADGLGGADGRRWRRVFGPLADGFDALAEDLMRPLTHVPRHPLRLAAFGPQALLPAAVTARLWRSPAARALFGGVAAHAFRPFHRPASAAVGLTIIAAGHRHGWPVAAGGSRAIADALAARLAECGSRIETGVRVRTPADLPPADVVLFDLAPRAVADILGDRLPRRVARAYRRFRHGPGAFKADFAVEGGVPWTSEAARRAGTVHLGGTFEEVAHTERTIHAGRMPERPFVLVGQQYLADPSRSKGDLHPVWTYAHVPHGYDGDATEAIIGQIERFAPGFRERVLDMAVRPPAAFETYNPNYVGGDIVTGANTALQLAMRPRLALDPYRTGVPGMYLCSAASPPGAGAHGMCGANAAASALRHLGRRPGGG
ncbi:MULTISPECIES: phytoene desaturase family protein [Streptomyces]|uniref:FAD-dependent oxidoreductase n=6 Tax=Streptomyces scabiei TaxID=1930 RepID=C9YZY3_STRSW|nr:MULTISPECIES: NAD(P)/FAD-dependent oxidoreductase [Streptomyces]MBP5865620.1 NAD(P)/FAD-dependent oxidoreductase [Streptomyces sp. LBUM 1484]MBP5872437.1 NAD(P)/FAD-dependent oxidoreductase [Streptomyces sp. LBUM 1485]MBP5933690.1 NAD(P)/FAD-dependent oxidoreductase [Streptomyces sp. LBUM 1479]KFG04328.1 FAD-dependent oxidoreductase [Streptomyces scabiei]MBP5873666.1 NAD(P)/FAD-dependent oxidoreductase [Streptomyces sp. LBUM 1477]